MVGLISKILLFAITVTFLLAWGYVKQQRKNQDLLNILNEKVKQKILDELKKKEALTKVEIEEIIKGTKASLFWSRNKVQVTDPKVISKNILLDMINNELIVEELNKGPKNTN